MFKHTVQVDDALNQLIDDTTAAIGNKGVTQNRGGKHVKRFHKNGRSHAKAQHNGKHFNGAHMQSERKSTSNHHVNTLREFTDAVESTADHTQTD